MPWILKQQMPLVLQRNNALISGFGKFCYKDKRELKGQNPTTGEDMVLVPRRVVTF